jgi:hypothetical protein
MKLKSTLILLAVFVVFLGFILFLDKKPGEKASGPEEKLVSLKSDDVTKIALKRGDETLVFEKDDKGDWMLREPLAVRGDNYEVGQLATSFADLKIERVVEKEKADLSKYQIPQKEVTLWTKGQATPVKILIGMENPIDRSLFAQKEGDPRVVLLSSTLSSTLDKKLQDFRQKDVFKYETNEVTAVKVKAKDVSWEAAKKDGRWFLEKPIRALARDSKIMDVLDSLSNMRAKEFAAEEKKPEALKETGLDKPEYEVAVSIPKASKEIVFDLHKGTDKTFATSSESTKIIVPESDPLAGLDKKPEDYRESKVAVFNTWQTVRFSLKKDGWNVTAAKAPNDKWYLDAAQKEEAEGTKIDSLVRKIENLEAAEYIDAPKALSEYGLDKPQAEITITTKEYGEGAQEKSVTILVGKTDPEKKQVVVKNAELAYLYRVDASFLDDVPKAAGDWKVAAPEKKEPEKKEPEKK